MCLCLCTLCVQNLAICTAWWYSYPWICWGFLPLSATIDASRCRLQPHLLFSTRWVSFSPLGVRFALVPRRFSRRLQRTDHAVWGHLLFFWGFMSWKRRALLKRQGGLEKPMSLFGTLLVLVIVSAVFIILMIGVIFDRVDKHKQEELGHKRETAQRLTATVVSLKRKTDWGDLALSGRHLSDASHIQEADPDSPDLDFYLMVEWTNPETQRSVISPTRVIHGPCPYHPGDEVFIYVHPAMREVWLDDPR